MRPVASRLAAIPAPEHPTYSIADAIQAALAEDAGDLGDVTTLSTIPEGTQATATLKAKAAGVLAGVAVVDQVFDIVDPGVEVTWRRSDGDEVADGEVFATISGEARSLLIGERIALNFMQRMSGIATATAAMVAEAEGHPARILETRKTVPGLRLLDKWAVLIGGGSNHRMGLYDMVMIKDNHIAAAGGITAAVARCEAWLAERGLSMGLEVETRTLGEVKEVLQLLDDTPDSKVSRMMLDNMTQLDASASSGINTEMLEEAVALIDGRIETEASGNVTLSTVRKIATSGVTYVSVGALTHSVMALDISMNIEL